MDEETMQDEFSFLSTAEAKADVLYDLAEEEVKSTDRRIGLVDITFPESLHDGLTLAMTKALSNRRFRLGLSLAKKAGQLEEIVTLTEETPLFEMTSRSTGMWSRSYSGEIPEEAKKIPGFVQKGIFCQNRVKNAYDWIEEIKSCVIHDVLIPAGENLRAAEGMIEIGQKKEAVSFSSRNLSPEQTAEFAERTNKGYDCAIAQARKEGVPSLVVRLMRSHIKHLENRDNYSITRWGERWFDVLSAAEMYEFSEEEMAELTNRAVDTAIQEFEERIVKWEEAKKDVRDKQNSNRSYYGGFKNESENHRLYEEEKKLEEERRRHLYSPESSVKALIEITPKERREEVKDKLLTICRSHYFLSEDKFSIAEGFGDIPTAFSTGMGFIRGGFRGHYYPGQKETIKGKVRGFLPKVGEEEKKTYIEFMISQNTSEAEAIADRFFLTDWLMDVYEKRGKKLLLGRYAEKKGRKDLAKKVYEEEGIFPKVLELTNDPFEKARCHLEIAKVEASGRTRKMSAVSPHRPERYVDEINSMNSAFSLALEGEKTREYRGAVEDTVRHLFSIHEYQEAILFGRKAGLGEGEIRMVLQRDALQKAEQRKDYAGCALLSQLKGNDTAVKAYSSLAQKNNQRVFTDLDEMSYIPPKEPVPEGEESIDDIPF